MGKTLGAAVCAVLLLVTAGCGSSRPAAGEVSTALQKGVASTKDKTDKLTLPKKQADCAAKIFVKSDISDKDLRQIVDDHKFNASKANEKIIEKVAEDLQKCVA
ncbi:MAG: hypothetical protein JWO46_2342 [Nocardioidaceae bacterium]|nr:hypothetical protein [Nocardioidaceae bacterium]